MEQFRPKTPEELQEQIGGISEVLETSIVQESTYQETLQLSLEEIKTKYPERYTVYLRLLRAQKNNQEVSQEELDEMNTWISALNNLDTYISKHKNNHENLDSRSKKQLDVFEDIRNSLEEGKKEGYIKLPTGVGKTVLFSRIVESLGLKTLIIVPSKILISQTGEKLEQFTELEFGKFFQYEKDLSKNVTVITYNSLIAGIKNGTINESDYDALILDEAHKALGEKTVKVLDKFDGIKLGFTATPKYSRDKHVSDLLEHEIHSMTVVEAAQERLISRFKSYLAYTDIDISSVNINNADMYDSEMLEKAIDKESRNRSALDLYKNQFDGQLAIAYCGGINHATHVAEMFNSGGVVAEVISGETSKTEKERILQDFKDGKIKVLCNAKILIEGFDEPKASVCLNLHPTLSYVDAEQRAGRVLRLNPDDPEKWGYIVDFIDQNPKTHPVTFVEIAQASRVDPDEKEFENQKVQTDRNMFGRERGHKPIPDIQLEGLRLVVDAQEVLTVFNEIETNRKKETTPPDWITLTNLSKKFGRDREYVGRLANPYRDTHPEWFKEYMITNVNNVRRSVEHFSPELIKELNLVLGNKEKSPPDWKTLSLFVEGLKLTDLAEFSLGEVGVQKIALPYRETHPEWFKKFLDGAGKMREHFSPELQEEIKRRVAEYRQPAGWLTNAAVAKILDFDKKTIARLANKYRDAHPEWFKEYEPSFGKKAEFYDPRLIQKIKESLNYRDHAPDGWMTTAALAKTGIASEPTVKKLVEKYKVTNPDLFGEYYSKAGFVTTFFSPEIGKMISKEINEYKSPPDQWMTRAQIVSLLKTSDGRAKSVIEKILENHTQHKDWFGQYRTSTGPREHYSPELVAEVRRIMGK